MNQVETAQDLLPDLSAFGSSITISKSDGEGGHFLRLVVDYPIDMEAQDNASTVKEELGSLEQSADDSIVDDRMFDRLHRQETVDFKRLVSQKGWVFDDIDPETEDGIAYRSTQPMSSVSDVIEKLSPWFSKEDLEAAYPATQVSDPKSQLVSDVLAAYVEDFQKTKGKRSEAAWHKDASEWKKEIVHDQRADNYSSLKIKRDLLERVNLTLAVAYGNEDREPQAALDRFEKQVRTQMDQPVMLQEQFYEDDGESFYSGTRQMRAIQRLLNDMDHPDIWRVSVDREGMERNDCVEKTLGGVKFIVEDRYADGENEFLEDISERYRLFAVDADVNVGDLDNLNDVEHSKYWESSKCAASRADIDGLIADFQASSGAEPSDQAQREFYVLATSPIVEGKEKQYLTQAAFDNPEINESVGLSSNVLDAAIFASHEDLITLCDARKDKFEPSDIHGHSLLDVKFGVGPEKVSFDMKPVQSVEPEKPVVAQRNQLSSGMGL